jgi:hypothetical protein
VKLPLGGASEPANLSGRPSFWFGERPLHSPAGFTRAPVHPDGNGDRASPADNPIIVAFVHRVTAPLWLQYSEALQVERGVAPAHHSGVAVNRAPWRVDRIPRAIEYDGDVMAVPGL